MVGWSINNGRSYNLYLIVMVKQKQRSKRREEYVIRIGPEFMELIQEQMKSIKSVTYGVVGDSTWEACEILAKKFKGEI